MEEEKDRSCYTFDPLEENRGKHFLLTCSSRVLISPTEPRMCRGSPGPSREGHVHVRHMLDAGGELFNKGRISKQRSFQSARPLLQ